MRKIPSSWISISFMDICDIQGGTQPAKTNFIYSPQKGFIRLLQIRDFGEKPLPTYVRDNDKLKKCNPNDILIARYGASIGRILTGFEGAYNVAMVKVIIPTLMNRKYIYHFLQSPLFQNPILSTKRSAQDGFNKDDLKKIILPLAPIKEQNRIVSKLDRIKEHISQLIKRSDNIADLEKAAFEGFMFKNDKIQPKKLANFCKERRERIGKNWRNKRLLGVSTEHGVIELRKGRKNSFENYKMVYPGDILYNPMRIDIGSVAIWESNEIGLTSPDYIVFTVNGELSPLLLLKFLKSNIGLEQIRQNTKGSVRSRLYFKNLVEINFPYFGLDEQKKAQVILKNFEKLKHEGAKVLEDMKTLLEKTYTIAFSGGLIKQNPKDQSAIILLKNIKEEMAMAKQIKTQKVSKPKVKAAKKTSDLTILEVLKKQKKAVPAKELWKLSKHTEIDDFYTNLRELFQTNKKIVETKRGMKSFISLKG